jgi:beta-phosphoglucomutase-like phosphatase (HAD superfamily)
MIAGSAVVRGKIEGTRGFASLGRTFLKVFVLYLDGKPRFDGVRDFLASHGIKLPEGGSDDPPQAETVRGLGNRKNKLVSDAIERVGVEALRGERSINRPVAPWTGSKSMAKWFETQHLAGKPAPDTFLMAAKLLGVLGVEPARAPEVQAGSSGSFGLMIGVARKGDAAELKQHGAHVVVNDLSEPVQWPKVSVWLGWRTVTVARCYAVSLFDC